MANEDVKKFSLPKFEEADPEIWFEVADTIFIANNITSERGKFSALLEKISTDQFRTIRDINNSTDPEVQNSAYTLAKKKLILVLGESKEKKLDKLLAASDIPRNTKPSIILQYLRDRAGHSQCDDIVKRIWLSKLPQQINVILAADKDTSLDTLAKNADNMYEVLSQTPPVSHSEVFEAHTSSATNSAILTAIQSLAAEVASLKIENNTFAKKLKTHRSRSKGRSNNSDSDSDSEERSRHRLKSRFTKKRFSRRPPPLFNGLCWYHHTFGDQAFKCASKNCNMKNKISTPAEN